MMTKRERLMMTVILIITAAWLVVGVFYVLEKAKPENILKLSTRFMNFQEMGFSKEQEFVEASAGNMRIEWPDTNAQQIVFQSETQPFFAEKSKKIQADMLVGGTQNTHASTGQKGYRVWLELSLFFAGKPQNAQRVEILLENEKERERLYSVQVNFGNENIDSYRISIIIEALENTIRWGFLQCSFLEVFGV